MKPIILHVEHLAVHFPVRQPRAVRGAATPVLRAVEDISLTVRQGETLGIVGESGCGKSTLSRAILQLIRPTSGRVIWNGESLGDLSRREMNHKRQELQIIFQDPLSSLNPRMTIGNIIGEPLRAFRPKMPPDERAATVREMMVGVGLEPDLINRYPHEFSGGQCQRVGIARAMILKPKLVICDEPVSALDVSTQAQVITLLKQLQRDSGTAFIFISHDLSVVRLMCERIVVMYLGRLVEIASRDELFNDARHPYTRALMSAIPAAAPGKKRPDRIILSCEVPSPLDPPGGCVFHTRCPRMTPRCQREAPTLQPITPTHEAACHYRDETDAQSGGTADR